MMALSPKRGTMQAILLSSLALCYLLSLYGIKGLTNRPTIASKTTTRAPSPAALFSSTASSSSSQADTRKKRRTRFHYSKKNVPATIQKQKSRARGNHPLVSLNLNLDSLAKSGAAPRAQELLQRIEALHQEGYYASAPDVVSYNCVLNAWALSTREPVERAVELFQKQVFDSHVRPTLITYNTLILAFSKRGQAQDAQHILEFLLEQDNGGIRPDTISWNSVLSAWAVQGNGKQAQALLKKMMAYAAEGDPFVKPDTISFNTVLHAFRGNPRRAQDLLEHMEHLYQAGNDDVEPDVYSYTSVIRAWAYSKRDKRASIQAKKLLETMETLSVEQDRPQLAPNTVTYSCVIQALAASNQAGSAVEAQEILERMLQRYKETGDDAVKPDVVLYTNLIDAWARDSSEHSAQRALELLQQMKESDIVEPNSRTYTSVFRALAKRGECNAAESLLRDLGQDPSIEPCLIHYNCVLDAHSKSKDWNKADRAMRFLEKMESDDNDVVPDIISYNSVLGACSNTYVKRAKTNALQVCLKVFKRRIVLEKATPVTYFLLFKALRKLLPQGDERRWKLVQQGFKLCCQAGLLSERVLKAVKRACTEEQYSTLIPTKTPKDSTQQVVRYSDLPKEWTRKSQRSTSR